MWVTAIGSTITESCSWLLLLFAAERLPVRPEAPSYYQLAPISLFMIQFDS